MKLNVSLRDGSEKIVDDILKFMLPDLNRAFAAATNKAETKIKGILHDNITLDPVYGSHLPHSIECTYGYLYR